MKTKVLIFVLAVLPVVSFATNPKSSHLLAASSTESVSIDEYGVEDWMTDLNSWAVASSGEMPAGTQASDSWKTDAEESEIELESWMLELTNNSWETSEVEQEIEVEDWMHEPSTWLITE